MTQPQAVPLVAVFIIVVVLLIRAREVRAWVAVVTFLSGVLVGDTPFMAPIVAMVNSLTARLFG